MQSLDQLFNELLLCVGTLWFWRKLRPALRAAVWTWTWNDHLNTCAVNLVRCSVEIGSEAYTVVYPMDQTPHIHTTLAGKRYIYQSYIEHLRRDRLFVSRYIRAEYYRFGGEKRNKITVILTAEHNRHGDVVLQRQV